LQVTLKNVEKLGIVVSNERLPQSKLRGDLGTHQEPSLSDGYVYRFGEFSLDSRKRTLSRADSPVSLTAKAFDVLLFLAQHPNRLVTKDELLKAVWGDTFVEEGNLAQYISHLRKALGDGSEHASLIVTIARKGYQFTADVTVTEAADSTKQAAVQVSSGDSSRADTPPGIESPAADAVPKFLRHWQKAAVVGACTVILAVVSVASWRRFGGATPPKSQKILLAVLPFENLTGDLNKEYLADGLTDETISQLGRLDPERLHVIARRSVMGYKHKNERLDRIGRDLSVQYVLENSFRENGDHMRITSQLLRVKDGSHVWSHEYDYHAQDILTVQEQVAKAVAREIELHLTAQQQAVLARSRPANPEAFDAYLQGHYFFERNTKAGTEMAVKYFHRATQLDPSYASAWVGLSRARNWQVNVLLISADEGHRLARDAVQRALALNPNLAEAHAQMARIQQQVDFNWAGADVSAQRALALEPGNPEMMKSAASSAAILGRFEEALQLNRRAVDLDPLSADSLSALASTEFLMAHLAEAEADGKKALELSADAWPGPILLSQIYLMQGRPQEALREIELARYDDTREFVYAMADYALGRKKESDAALRTLVAKHPAGSAYVIAEVYAFRNQSAEAFEWLDRANAQRDSGLIQTKTDPFLKSLHKDPRFAAFLKKLNVPN
jgi:TolB-like protein/DNA-binding winged helix-turn-helix (wHTH) protein